MDTDKRKQIIEKYWKRCAVCNQGIKNSEFIISLSRKIAKDDIASKAAWSIKEQTSFKNCGLMHHIWLHESCYIREVGEDFIFWNDEDEI